MASLVICESKYLYGRLSSQVNGYGGGSRFDGGGSKTGKGYTRCYYEQTYFDKVYSSGCVGKGNSSGCGYGGCGDGDGDGGDGSGGASGYGYKDECGYG